MAVTSVASGIASVQLLAPDTSRNYVIIENSDANRLYVLYDSGTASASNYSISLAQYENAIVPAEFAGGEIKGIWAADGSGSAHITHR